MSDFLSASTDKQAGKKMTVSEYLAWIEQCRQTWLKQFEKIKQSVAGPFTILPTRAEIRWLIHELDLYSRLVVVNERMLLSSSHSSVEEMEEREKNE